MNNHYDNDNPMERTQTMEAFELRAVLLEAQCEARLGELEDTARMYTLKEIQS